MNADQLWETTRSKLCPHPCHNRRPSTRRAVSMSYGWQGPNHVVSGLRIMSSLQRRGKWEQFWKDEGDIGYTPNTHRSRIWGIESDGQINIMALFGNGVDIQLMEYLGSPYRTSYQNFYNYLCYKNFDKDNIIFKKWLKIRRKWK